MAQGFIQLHRKMIENPLVSKPIWAWLWVVLLLKAGHKETTFIWNEKNITLKPGQFITGRKELSLLTKIPETTIERILKYLENGHQIGQQKTTKYRIITILKWNEYQKRTAKRTTDGQQTDTNNNDNNDNNILPAAAGKISVTNNDDRVPDNPPLQSSRAEAIQALVRVVETKRGTRFINRKKQEKFISEMLDAGRTPKEIGDRWLEMSERPFYKNNKIGFDFKTVQDDFDRKP